MLALERCRPALRLTKSAMPHPAPIKNRQIRVFISSTFRDMQGEREVLIKKIFPQLRKLCEERAVTWTEVDLRWGINAEQAEQGEIIPLCLAEIERCQPFFIGLLGEYYGTPLAKLSPNLRRRDGWPIDAMERSITELEFIHGVLRDEHQAKHAYFYFRDPGFIDDLPPGSKVEDFASQSFDARGKLEQLKTRIREASARRICTLRDGYRNPEVLGRAIRRDFSRLIDRLFPKDEVPDALDQEAARHEAYCRGRRLGFFGRDDLLRQIDERASSEGNRLVLHGEAGCGKSALLAEWAARWQVKHPDDFVFVHYIGSAPGSADWQSLVRRVLAELKRAFSIGDDIPTEPQRLRVALADWAEKAIGLRRIILVLDGLNQLDEEGAAKELSWLPEAFPANFRVLVSTLAGESLEILRRRGWSEIAIPLFTAADIRPAALTYFSVFGKTPSSQLLAKLESTAAACNPLYLRGVLDELRQFGRHEELEAKAADYLAAPDLPDLYNRILTRWHDDFGRDEKYPDLVRRALRLIACARFGLTERELLELLGAKSELLPRRIWTPFHLAAEYPLTQQMSVFNFGHEFMRAVVRNRWLPNADDVRRVQQQLAEYFGETSEPDQRKLDELPTLLIELQQWGKLKDLLTDMAAFYKLYCDERWRWELHRYWHALRPYYSCAATYLEMPPQWAGRPQENVVYKDALHALGLFLQQQAESEAAGSIFRELLAHIEHAVGPDHPDLCAALDSCAWAAAAAGRMDEADQLSARSLAIAEKSDRSKVVSTAGFRALLLKTMRRYDEAELLYRQALAVEEERGKESGAGLVAVLSNLAQLLQSTTRLQEAEPIMRRVLNITITHYGEMHPHAATALHNLGALLCDLERYEEAEPLLRRALAILETYLRQDHPRITMTVRRLSTLLGLTNRLDEAAVLRERALSNDISLLGPAHPDVARDLNALGLLYYRMGKNGIGESLWRRAIGIYKRDGRPGDQNIAWCVENLARLLRSTGRTAEAERLSDWLAELEASVDPNGSAGS